MPFYRLTYYYFAMLPVVSGTILLEFRVMQLSVVTFLTLLMIFVAVISMVQVSKARIGTRLLFLLGLCCTLFLFREVEIGSILWVVLFVGGFAIGKNLSSSHLKSGHQLIKVIKPMVILTTLVCLLQFIIQDRFLGPDLAQKLHPDIFAAPWGYRLSAFSASPNALGYFLVFTIWTSFVYQSLIFKSNFWFKCFMLMQIIILFLTLSRGAFLALCATFLLHGAYKMGLKLFLAATLILMMFVLFSYVEEDPLRRALADPRIFGFINAVVYIAEVPQILFLGLGFSDEVLRTVAFSDNFILQIVVGGGVPALLLLRAIFPNVSKTESIIDKTYLKGISTIFLISMLLTASPQFLYFFFPAITFYFTVYFSSRGSTGRDMQSCRTQQ